MLWTVCPDISDWCFFLRQASAYPKLYALMHNTPNLNNQFLRGTSTKSNVLKTVSDSIATHHSEIQNLHVTSRLQDNTVTTNLSNTKIKGTTSGTVSGTAQSSSITSGTAKGQSFTVNNVNLTVSGTAKGQTYQKTTANVHEDKDHHRDDSYAGQEHGLLYGSISTSQATANDSSISGKATGSITGKSNDSSITGTVAGQKFTSNKATWDLNGELITGYSTGKVTNGNVTGTIDNSDVLYSGKKNTYSGRDETAPMHMFVRFLIRAAE